MRVQHEHEHERAQTDSWLVVTWDTSGVPPGLVVDAVLIASLGARAGRVDVVVGPLVLARPGLQVSRRGAYAVQLVGRDRHVASYPGGPLRVVASRNREASCRITGDARCVEHRVRCAGLDAGNARRPRSARCPYTATNAEGEDRDSACVTPPKVISDKFHPNNNTR